MATIAENLQKIVNATKAIKEAIIAKGGSVTDIESYADAINNLSSNEKQLITFSVDGISYTAELGMLWEDFLESEYNTGEFSKSVPYVMYNGYNVFDLNSDNVAIFHTITSNRNYVTMISGGAD